MSNLRQFRFAAITCGFVLATAAAWATLLGVTPGVPTTTFSLPGTTTYDSETQVFSVSATPVLEAFGAPIGTKTIATPRNLTINIQVDNTGTLVGGVAGHDLTLTGSIDTNGDSVAEYSGVLLTGEVLAFGSQNVSTTDAYDFRFQVTGGALAALYGTNDIGLRLTSENSTFTGSFAANFSGLAKGTIGPIPTILLGRIGDLVWQDTDKDGIQDAGEPGIPNVTLWLKDASNNTIATTTTDVNGNYLFPNLPPGTYTVVVDVTTLPSGLAPTLPFQGSDTAVDSEASPTSLPIVLPPGGEDLTIDFGYYPTEGNLDLLKSAEPESAAPYQPVTYTYHVTNTGGTTLTDVVIRDDNGTPDMTSDDFIVGTVASLGPGATATFTKVVYPPVATETVVNNVTYPAGLVVAEPLPDGNLKITYIQDFGINDNTYGTGAIGWPSGHTFGNLTGSDKLEFRLYDKDGNVVLDFYQDYLTAVTPTAQYPSGYRSLCATGGDGSMVSGTAANILSCTTSLAENLNNSLNVPYKSALTVNSPTSLVGSTVVVNTAAAPGGWDYINRYTAIIDGDAFGPDGVANFGSVSVPDQHNSPSKLGTNSLITKPKDSIVTNHATVFVDANGNQLPDPGELQDSADETVSIIAQPSSLSGFVYIDAGNDGTRAGDTGIAGVTVTLTGTNISGSVSLTTTTDANGFYQFPNLLEGTYTITETQPGSPYLDGVDTLGNLGGTLAPDSFTNIVIGPNTFGTEYNFGERQAGMLAGIVYADSDNDGVKDAAETPMSGVTVRLFSGTTLVQTATTNAAGTYAFSGMAPGTYTIVETQPAAYLDGRDTVGTGLTTPGTAASDIFSGIGVVATEAGAGYNFGEIVPSATATSRVSKVFTKTVLTAGQTLWFSSRFRAGGLTTVGQGDVTLRMVNSRITLTPKGGGLPITIPTPDVKVVFVNSLPGGATTTFDAATNTWVTYLQKGTTNDWFLNAMPYQIPLSPDLKEATFSWTGTFIVDTAGVDVTSWSGAAAEYNVATPTPANYNAIGVKPTDNATPAYPNTDQAGVPENWKASFVANTGTGGSTQPGAYTANGNPATQVLPTPADPTETFATTPVIYP